MGFTHRTAFPAADTSDFAPNQTARIAYAERRVKPLARLLRCATALRVTAPLGYGSGGWYDRKVPFRPVHTARPLSSRLISPTTRCSRICVCQPCLRLAVLIVRGHTDPR